jgi:hypothetical protein
MPDPGIPFTLKLAEETSLEHGRVVMSVSRVAGHARLDGDRLVVEWSGTRDVEEVGPGQLRRVSLPIPVGHVAVPVARLLRVGVRRRWWRPRLELVTTDPGAFAGLPGALGGRLELQLSRRDVSSALEWVTTVRLEMADYALRAAEGSAPLPPPPPT